jgi:hypothetical protein
MSLTARLLEDGFVPVDLKAGNVKPGDAVVNRFDMFGTLLKITKKGNYVVSFDIDYADDKPTKFSAQEFERIFLVDKRKKV